MNLALYACFKNLYKEGLLSMMCNIANLFNNDHYSLAAT